jgi:hypothetical protein
MANPLTAARLIELLASKHRVVMLGGLAVVSHGHSRPTFDADIWLDPNLPIKEWCESVLDLKNLLPDLKFLAIAVWNEIPDSGLAEVVQRDGVLRVTGANQPLDIFRAPNELPIEEFEATWERATPLTDGTRLPDEIDLLMTKQLTGRDKDTMDIAFLENKAEKRYLTALPSAPPELAISMLNRFLTPKVAELALLHPAESVRLLALSYLQELSSDGDPFATDILKSLNR